MKKRCNSCGRFFTNNCNCKKGTNFECFGETCTLKVSYRGGKKDVLVDKDKIKELSKYRWHVSGGRYVKNTKLGTLHKFIFGSKEGYFIDHINRDIYDNRVANLRFADDRENQLNSRCKGYCYNKRHGKWYAYIRYEKCKTKHLGTFNSEEEARQARIDAEKKYYGDFRFKRDE